MSVKAAGTGVAARVLFRLCFGIQSHIEADNSASALQYIRLQVKPEVQHVALCFPSLHISVTCNGAPGGLILQLRSSWAQLL